MAFHAALEDAVETFDGVCVGFGRYPANVFFPAVVYPIVTTEIRAGSEALILAGFVGENECLLGDVLVQDRNLRALLEVVHDGVLGALGVAIHEG